MDIHEQDDLRAFLTSLFGRQVQGWPMNENMFNLTFELVAESSACSSAMDLVPRPMPLGGQPIKWLKKQVREMFLRELKDRKENYVAALGWLHCKKSGSFN